MIREKTRIGNNVAIGTATVIEGNTIIGDEVNLQSMIYIPTDTVIGNHVFIGPNAVLTNDRYPPTRIGGLQGPQIRDGAAIGANATLLPGVCIGEGGADCCRCNRDPRCPGAYACDRCAGKNHHSAFENEQRDNKKIT